MAIEATDRASDHLQALKELGVTLAMDDFGTGYSSLAYLRRLPFDIIKIDRSFVQHVTDSDDAAHMVEAIVYMAHGLRLKVIAEGVESAAQQLFLQGCGCDYLQGYHIAAPQPADAVRRLLDASAQSARRPSS